MMRTWARGWRWLALRWRLAGFVFCVCLAGFLVGDAAGSRWPVWTPWALAGFTAWVAFRWIRPIESVVAAAHRLVAGEDLELLDEQSEGELDFLARAVREMATQLEASRHQLEERNFELERANEVLAQLSITDGLTRLHNHRHFHDRYQAEARRVRRTGHPLGLILMDIDDFKGLNDRHGHSVGDRVLASVAALMAEQVRETDYLARYGGEEFAILLPETDLEGSALLAEKIRLAISEAEVVAPDAAGPVRVTLSAGVALFDGDTDRSFDAADRALYRAKSRGKDCVVLATT